MPAPSSGKYPWWLNTYLILPAVNIDVERTAPSSLSQNLEFMLTHGHTSIVDAVSQSTTDEIDCLKFITYVK